VSFVVAIAAVGWAGLIGSYVLLLRMQRLLRRMVDAINSDGEGWPTENFLEVWADAVEAVIGKPRS